MVRRCGMLVGTSWPEDGQEVHSRIRVGTGKPLVALSCRCFSARSDLSPLFYARTRGLEPADLCRDSLLALDFSTTTITARATQTGGIDCDSLPLSI
jgi:hypothetical protein